MLEKFASDTVTALVIEDEETTRELVARLLSAMGAKSVFVARDGGEGLRIACEQGPSVITCDLEMQPVDGLAFLGGLRNCMKKSVAATPVVMFTGTKDGDLVQRAKALGVSGYFIKPFNPQGFSKFIRELVTPEKAATPES